LAHGVNIGIILFRQLNKLRRKKHLNNPFWF
jgi:hypothetical protein